MDQSFMKERKILPLVLSMSLPMVISMAVNALYKFNIFYIDYFSSSFLVMLESRFSTASISITCVICCAARSLTALATF